VLKSAESAPYLAVPLREGGALAGIISLYRKEVRAFTDRQIALVQGFAAQAEIAMKNARLFEEVQAKTRELTEALTYQTGSSKILSVIASSPTDVGPVLNAVVESACELCEADLLDDLKEAQIAARLQLANWIREVKVAIPLAQAFEEVFIQAL
jgi:GAF domain-containing protein